MTGTPAADIVAPALYEARLVHTRTERIHRSFTHRIHLWLVDLDALPVLPGYLRPFVRFDARDHLGHPSSQIRDNVDAWLRTRGIDLHGGRVLMLCQARSLGYVFNPLTIYWCYRDDGTAECIIAEVQNTYGQLHCYLLQPDERGRSEVAKTFYVSPFLAVDGRYVIRISQPGPAVAVSVALYRDDALAFAASVRGTRRPVTPRELARLIIGQPLASYRTSALIRLHGIRLWLRRVPVIRRPPSSAKSGVPLKECQ